MKQNRLRRARGRSEKSSVRNKIKVLRMAVAAGEKDGIRELLRDATSALHKAASKGVLPRKRASRLTSRLTRSVNKIDAP